VAEKNPVPNRHPALLSEDGKTWNKLVAMEAVGAQLSRSSLSLDKTLKEGYEGFALPTWSEVSWWVRKDEECAQIYADAKAAQMDYLAEELLEIADDGKNDYMQRSDPNNPGYAFNGEHSARSRLRLDTRKWLMSKLKPRKYGDRTILAGDPEAPLHPAAKQDLSKLTKKELDVLIELQSKIEDIS